MKRAASLEELEPLVALCKAGRLFDVQEWVGQGKPVALPPDTRGRGAKRNPLRIAMENGFHSLVQVLLEAGAPVREGYYNALEHAVELRRPDLAKLLIRHGAAVGDVSMRWVIEMWQPEMVELFLSNGASLTSDHPLAWGFIYKIRPTLGLLKRSIDENPELMMQANLALRFHASEGNSKWVALLLWAGADPLARGVYRLEDLNDGSGDDDDDHANAVELAITYGRVDVLKLKKMLPALDPEHPETSRLVEDACHAPTSEVLSMLLDRGYSPVVLADRGTAAITSALASMSWDLSFTSFDPGSLARTRAGIDTPRSRDRMKMLHMLVARGAKWLPGDKRAITDVRQNLSKMAPDYILEFLWLMQRYGAARRQDVQELFRTPLLKRVLGQEHAQAQCIVRDIPEEPVDGLKE
jgi:hypothetical protein